MSISNTHGDREVAVDRRSLVDLYLFQVEAIRTVRSGLTLRTDASRRTRFPLRSGHALLALQTCAARRALLSRTSNRTGGTRRANTSRGSRRSGATRRTLCAGGSLPSIRSVVTFWSWKSTASSATIASRWAGTPLRSSTSCRTRGAGFSGRPCWSGD